MSKRTRTAFASVDPPTGLADELLEQIVAFRPIETALVETQIGPSEATIAQVITVTEDGKPRNHGELPIFWVVVRDQIRKATAEVPWVVGVLTRTGRAYRLRDLATAEIKRVSAAFAVLPD